MQDKTINNALQQLYREALNGNGEGREHILALMELRGIEPAAKVRSPNKLMGQRGTKLFVLDALREGHRTPGAVTDLLLERFPHLTRREAYNRVYQVMWRMGVSPRDRAPHKESLASVANRPISDTTSCVAGGRTGHAGQRRALSR